MKEILVGAVAAISLGFATTAFAGDDLVAQCKANAEAEGTDVAANEAFCGCLVEQAAGNADLLAEFGKFAKVEGAEARSTQFEAEASEAAKAAVAACTPEEPAQ